MNRTFVGTSGVAPMDAAICGLHGDPMVDNKLALVSANQLSISASYSGVPYTFDALGVKLGDKIQLLGVGTEPNYGREVTITDPTGIDILEDLTFPDSTEYEFIVLRRNL